MFFFNLLNLIDLFTIIPVFATVINDESKNYQL